jgi:hypothetical protein
MKTIMNQDKGRIFTLLLLAKQFKRQTSLGNTLQGKQKFLSTQIIFVGLKKINEN